LAKTSLWVVWMVLIFGLKGRRLKFDVEDGKSPPPRLNPFPCLPQFLPILSNFQALQTLLLIAIRPSRQDLAPVRDCYEISQTPARSTLSVPQRIAHTSSDSRKPYLPASKRISSIPHGKSFLARIRLQVVPMCNGLAIAIIACFNVEIIGS
jgi:hypothetical protein